LTTSGDLTRRAPRWWLVLAALVGLSAWLYLRPVRASDGPSVFDGATMGTTYRVVLGRRVESDRVRALQRGVDSLLTAVNASMSTYDSTSELSRFNGRADTTRVPVSDALAEVLRVSLAVHAASEGLFDVTVGPLVDAWGFGPASRPTQALPQAQRDSLRALVGSGLLAFDGTALRKRDPRVRIDLSAVAKGYAVDVVSDWLSANGAADHLVEIGGEMQARGRNARGEPFRVGIEDPDPNGRRVRFAIALSDRALASSGNYRNFVDLNGVRYAHTIDPVSGAPVQHTLLAVSVLHARCADADAWATALMVAGPERAWALAQANDLDVGLLISTGPGEVSERFTDGFRAAVLPSPLSGAPSP
jgi:thiamine biosynthesis lipoprotein